jgi:hypothetical protein
MLKSSILVSQYFTLASQCRSQNQSNKLHIDLENLLAPGELIQIADLAKTQQLPPSSCRWLESIERFSPELFDSPQRYRRRALCECEHVLIYQDPDRDAASKSLLVAFAGNGRRLGMPTSVFLQCLDSAAWDVVLLRKGPQKKSYVQGLEGISTHFPGLIRYLQTAATPRQYRRVVTLGTSGGGYAAILAAVLMNTSRGISICGAPPKSPSGLSVQWKLASFRVRRQLAICQRATGKPRQDLHFVYGADCAPDRESALSLLSSFDGMLRPAAEVGEHNLLGALLKRGQFTDFLNEMLA